MYAPDEQGNFLRQLMQSGMAPDAQNELLAMLQQPDFVAQPVPSLVEASQRGQDAGFGGMQRPQQPQFAPVQHAPPAGVDSGGTMRGSLGDSELQKFRATAAQSGIHNNGQLEEFMRTGQAPQRQAMQPQGQQRMNVAGFGGGTMTDLGQMDAPAPQLDYSRPLEVAGKGKGYWGKDGNIYTKGPNGQLTKTLPGYDRKASQEAANNDLERRRGEAGLDLTRQQIAASREQVRASEATRTTKENKPSAGQTAVDKEFAKEYVAYRATGGFADTQKQLAQLKDVHKQLGEGRNLTGTVVGNAPDWMLAIQNPQALAARDAVEEVVQRNLRTILGAQFTNEEGKRLIARAYNPKLGELENQKRLGRLITQIESAAKTKQDASDYFEAKGTLTGWKGKMPSWSDFDPDSDRPGQGGSQGTQFDSLPNPASYSGKRMQGPDGIYKSNGSQWVKE